MRSNPNTKKEKKRRRAEGASNQNIRCACVGARGGLFPNVSDDNKKGRCIEISPSSEQARGDERLLACGWA